MDNIIKPIIFDLNEIRKKAENDDGFACYILGRSYDSEENGAEQSFEKAMYWYERGMQLGDPRCAYGVGACYYFGDGVEQDKEKAKQIHIKVYESLLKLINEEQGSLIRQAFSKFCLGAYYYFGFGNVDKDEEKAFELIDDCAKQGHLPAIYDLGANFYYNGVGTEKNLRLSEYYLEMAAKTGLPRAKVKLEQYQDTYKDEIENKNIKELLNEISNKYQHILEGINLDDIKKVIDILDDRRKNINSNQNKSLSEQIQSSNPETKRIFQLMEQYKEEIKQMFIEKGKNLFHITDISPENMIDGKIQKSINRVNTYETEIGNWVFASSVPVNGNNPYLARNAKDGMILIAKKTYIYGVDNIKMQRDSDGNNRVVLKQPNYVYEISPQNFTPVVTLRMKKEGKPYFEFSEEWISDKDIDINDSNEIKEVSEVSDITDVVRNYQVLCDVNKNGIAWKIRSSKDISSAVRILRENIKSGNLRYINREADINVNDMIDRTELESNNKNRDDGNNEERS